MGFKLADETYLWPVTIDVPRNGKFVPVKFRARFRLLSQSRIDEIIDSGGDDDLVDEVLDGWEDFLDAEGKPIEYTDANRAQALDMPFVRRGLLVAFMASLAGRQDRRKN